MSALGQKQTFKRLLMSALPPKADIANYFNALADDIADFITEPPVTVGAARDFLIGLGAWGRACCGRDRGQGSASKLID
jgi:hypothetical protein